jgi:hypothetical protein
VGLNLCNHFYFCTKVRFVTMFCTCEVSLTFWMVLILFFSFVGLFRVAVDVSEETDFHYFELFKFLDKPTFVICCFYLQR